MDPFLETFWNLDQVRGWAATRDPEYVRAAAFPLYGKPKKSLEIAIRVSHSATTMLRERRDIDAGIVVSKRLDAKDREFVVPKVLQDYADKRGKPAYPA